MESATESMEAHTKFLLINMTVKHGGVRIHLNYLLKIAFYRDLDLSFWV